MPRYPSAGITALSQLAIDADKVWATKGISNIKELALGMVQGDILVHDGTRIIRLAPGVANMVLTSGGAGVVPSWQPGGLFLNRYFPATISHARAAAIVVAAKAINENAPLATAHVEAYNDQPALLVSRTTPVLASARTATIIAAPNWSQNKNAPATRAIDLQLVVDGAIADDGGVLTDETAAAQSAAANDMTLLPAAPVVNDAYDLGFPQQFDQAIVNIGIPGVGVWTITWKYWNGAWVALAGVVDGTTGFQAAAGLRTLSFTRPGDWALLIISGLNRYWIRADLTAFTNQVTQPKGTQAWIVRNT